VCSRVNCGLSSSVNPSQGFLCECSTSSHRSADDQVAVQAKTAQVVISDLDAATVERMLMYCYGCLQQLPSDHDQVTTRDSPLPHFIVRAGHSGLSDRDSSYMKPVSAVPEKSVVGASMHSMGTDCVRVDPHLSAHISIEALPGTVGICCLRSHA